MTTPSPSEGAAGTLPPYQRFAVQPVDATRATGGQNVSQGDSSGEHGNDGNALAAWEARHQPLWALGVHTLQEQWRRMLRCEPGVRLERDPEDVHKMRVATRRLRAAASVFGPSIDAAAGAPLAAPLVENARTLAGALGLVRDLDVFLLYLDEAAKELPADHAGLMSLRRRHSGDRQAAHVALLAALDGAPMAMLRRDAGLSLQSVAGNGARDGVTGREAGARGHKRTQQKDRVGQAAPAMVARRVRRLRRLVRGQVAPGEAGLHQVRIQAKKVRYLAEFLSPAFPASLDPLATLATGMQDSLGTVHDLHVFDAILFPDLESLGGTSDGPGVTIAVAHLLQRNVREREVALARFRELWATLPGPAHVRRDMKKEARAWKHSP